MTDTLFDPLLAVDALRPWQRHEPTPAFTHPSQTSQDAAFSLVTKTQTLQRRVLKAISEAPDGLTDLEIVEVTGLEASTARPRRVELCQPVRDKEGNLVRRALIESCGTRATKSGRQAQIWKVKQ